MKYHHKVAFHWGLNCLLKHLFTGIQNEKGLKSQTFVINLFMLIITLYANIICEAPITQTRMCIIKIVTFKGGQLIW